MDYRLMIVLLVAFGISEVLWGGGEAVVLVSTFAAIGVLSIIFYAKENR